MGQIYSMLGYTDNEKKTVCFTRQLSQIGNDETYIVFTGEYNTQKNPVIEIDQTHSNHSLPELSTIPIPPPIKITVKTHDDPLNRKILITAKCPKEHADKHLKWRDDILDYFYCHIPWWTDVFTDLKNQKFTYDCKNDPHADNVVAHLNQSIRQNRLFVQLRSLNTEYEIVIPKDSHLEFRNIYKDTVINNTCVFEHNDHPIIVTYYKCMKMYNNQNLNCFYAQYPVQPNGRLRLYQSEQNIKSDVRTRIVIRSHSTNNYVKIIRIRYPDQIYNDDKFILPLLENMPFLKSNNPQEQKSDIDIEDFHEVQTKKLNLIAGNCLDITICESAFYIIYIPDDMELSTDLENANVDYDAKRYEFHATCYKIMNMGDNGYSLHDQQSWTYYSPEGDRDPRTKIITKKGVIKYNRYHVPTSCEITDKDDLFGVNDRYFKFEHI